MFPKHKRYANRKYLDWVKTLPCVVCAAPADDAHHIKGAGLGGMARKPPDWAVMPVTRGCHQLIHRGAHQDRQWGWVYYTLARARADGILVFDMHGVKADSIRYPDCHEAYARAWGADIEARAMEDAA